MRNDRDDSSLASGAARQEANRSPEERPPETASRKEKPDAPDEGEFLTDQARAAREAIGETMASLKHHLKRAADPRSWIQEHPIASLASSMGIGFAAGVAVTPTRDQTIRDKYYQIVSTLKGPAGEKVEKVEAGRKGERPKVVLREPSFWKLLLDLAGKAVAFAFALSQKHLLHPSTNGRE